MLNHAPLRPCLQAFGFRRGTLALPWDLGWLFLRNFTWPVSWWTFRSSFDTLNLLVAIVSTRAFLSGFLKVKDSIDRLSSPIKHRFDIGKHQRAQSRRESQNLRLKCLFVEQLNSQTEDTGPLECLKESFHRGGLQLLLWDAWSDSLQQSVQIAQVIRVFRCLVNGRLCSVARVHIGRHNLRQEAHGWRVLASTATRHVGWRLEGHSSRLHVTVQRVKCLVKLSCNWRCKCFRQRADLRLRSVRWLTLWGNSESLAESWNLHRWLVERRAVHGHLMRHHVVEKSACAVSRDRIAMARGLWWEAARRIRMLWMTVLHWLLCRKG